MPAGRQEVGGVAGHAGITGEQLGEEKDCLIYQFQLANNEGGNLRWRTTWPAWGIMMMESVVGERGGKRRLEGDLSQQQVHAAGQPGLEDNIRIL